MREEAYKGLAAEPRADELATALAMMHATLESTTDVVLVNDEANYVREFNEKYVRFWGIPPHMMVSAHAGELWNYVSPQLKDPDGYLARLQEIVASAAPKTFDVLQLKDGRVFEQNSAIQLIKQRNVGRVWTFRDITQRRRAQDALANDKRVLEKIASGASLGTVLNVLVRGVEAQRYHQLAVQQQIAQNYYMAAEMDRSCIRLVRRMGPAGVMVVSAEAKIYSKSPSYGTRGALRS